MSTRAPRRKDLLARLRRFRCALGMNTFVKAVVSGFAFTLGATLFRKVAKKIGLEEDTKTPTASAAADAPNGETSSSSPSTTQTVVH
jgi:hypothetical protein